MAHRKTVLSLSVTFSVLVGECCLKSLQFPAGFKFGAASSAYQVEGACNVSDKSPNVWDLYTHTTPGDFADGGTGDVACDSYRLWRRDIEMAAELGLDFYRFSISWSRLLPNGFSNHISEDGKNYYNNLIDGLLERGIEPVVTLHHWDLPQVFEDLGGWLNPIVTDYFANYTRVVYSLFGNRVSTWFTLNEPATFCDTAYITGYFAPGVDPERAALICHKNMLIAHAKAWRVYDEEFKPEYHGEVSIANIYLWTEPKNDEDADFAKLILDFDIGRSSDPIYSKQGGWSPHVEAIVANTSSAEGYSCSKLPSFTKEEIELVKGTYDFLALNYYFTRQIRKLLPGEKSKPRLSQRIGDAGAILEIDQWPVAYTVMPDYPEGLRCILRELKSRYGDIKVFIAENGFADLNTGLNDDKRVSYFRDSFEQTLLAINEDGVNVVGYTAWSLMDTFEWFNGYRSRFGLYEVDFTDPLRVRTPRTSALYYANVIRNRTLYVQ